MRTLAVTEKEDMKISFYETDKTETNFVFLLQRYIGGDRAIRVDDRWSIVNKTEEIWVASKWIEDFKMKTAKNYPSLKEILNVQDELSKEFEEINKFDLIDISKEQE